MDPLQHQGKQMLLGEIEPSSMGKRKKANATRNLLNASLCSYMAAMSFGYMIGYSSPALPQMTQNNGPLDEQSASWFGSIATFGAIFGCPIAGLLVERAGRKMTLMLTTVPYILGWCLILGFSDFMFLCCGRLLTGVASGMVTVVSPMFISETSTKELRGMLGSGVQLSITVGILLVYTLGMVAGWRLLAAVGLLIPIIALVLTFRVPDTPRYYLVKGQKNEALRALAWLRNCSPGEAEEECRDMEESLDSDEKMAWGELVHKQELLQPLKVSVGLMIFQQLSGINVVMFYTVSIFQSAGFGDSGQLATVVIGIVQVAGTLVACLLMDRAGRRLLLIVGGFGMAFTCFTMGVYYYKAGVDTTSAAAAVTTAASGLSWLALASLVLYVIAFSLGWGPIPMLVMSEIFPSRARGTASAIASVTNWSFAFLVTKEFQFLQDMLGPHGAFWFFGSCCTLGVMFVVRYVPETKGKSLEDIEMYFLGRSTRGI